MTDYEALGHYVDAKERLAEHLMKRDEILHELEKVIKEAQGSATSLSSSGSFINFRVTKAQELISKLDELAVTINDAVTEINSNAQKAGKSTVRIV